MATKKELKPSVVIGTLLGIGTLMVGVLTLTEPKYPIIEEPKICGFNKNRFLKNPTSLKNVKTPEN